MVFVPFRPNFTVFSLSSSMNSTLSLFAPLVQRGTNAFHMFLCQEVFEKEQSICSAEEQPAEDGVS